MYAFRPPALIPLNQGKEETSSPVRQACAVVRKDRIHVERQSNPPS